MRACGTLPSGTGRPAGARDKQGINPIPVVDDGRLVGIISRYDVIRLMATDTERHGQQQA